MKLEFLIVLLMLSSNIFAQDPKITIFQDGEEYRVENLEEMIELKNKAFSIRYTMPKTAHSPKLSLYAYKPAFDRVRFPQNEEYPNFASGGTYALGYAYKSYAVVTPYSDFKGDYYLAEYHTKIDSTEKEYRFDFPIKQIEGVEIQNIFLENVYVSMFFDSNDNYILEPGELAKFTLHFKDAKIKKELVEDIIDLEQIDFDNFDAEAFYVDAVKKERIFKAFITKTGSQPGDYNGPPAFLQYERAMYSSLMQSVHFRSLDFPIMEATLTKEGQLMAVAALSEYLTTAKIRKTIQSLGDEYGEPSSIEQDGRMSLTWHVGDKKIQISFEYVPTYEALVLIRIFIVKDEFEEDIRKLAVGIWYRYDTE